MPKNEKKKSPKKEKILQESEPEFNDDNWKKPREELEREELENPPLAQLVAEEIMRRRLAGEDVPDYPNILKDL